MKQPEFGALVSQARKQKGLTQESLAESCDVSVRTIQRIENGSVTPQAFTANALVDQLGMGLHTDGRPEHSGWIILMHLSTILLLVPVPWLILAFRGSDDFLIHAHAKKVLNFQLTMVVAMFAWFGFSFLFGLLLGPSMGALLGVLVVVCILPPILLSICILILSLRNCAHVLDNRDIHYPCSIKFMK